MAPDTIMRIYSMTKPLTSVAIMMLYEQGLFQLDDPIARYLPSFAGMRVAAGGQRGKIDTVPAARDITFRDLLTHTSGLTYGFMQSTLVDALYRDGGHRFPDRRMHAERIGRAAGEAAPARAAGRRVELQRRHGCARPSGGGDLRRAVRRIPRAPGDRAARHDRHRVPRAGRPAWAVCGQLRPRPRGRPGPDRRPGVQPLFDAAGDLLGRRRAGVDRGPTTCGSASSCSIGACWTACACWGARRWS